MSITHYQIILFVADQKRSRDFYSAILKKKPALDVPGMTEFILDNNLKLGLKPENGIAKILKNKAPHPNTANGIPRCELYLRVDDLNEVYETSLKAGAKEISCIQEREWGDTAGYVSDFDGHLIAFAASKD